MELGYDAFALTDHDGLSGSMEFAAGRGRARPAGHPRRRDGARGRPPRHAAGRGRRPAGATSAASSRPPTRTSRDKDEPPPRVPCATLEEHAQGLVCLSGCARQGVHDEAGAAAAAAHLRRRAPARRAAAAVPARRPGAEPRARRAERSSIGVPTVATGNVHAHARTRAALQDAFVALRNHTTLDASEPLRRGNFSHVLASPKAMEARFADDHPRALAADARARRPPDLRPHPRPRLPLPRLGGPGGHAHARRDLRPQASRSATRPAHPTATPPSPASRRSCA